VKTGAGPLFRLFGGKGGVGKTTCAAAWGLARAEAGTRALVLSVDPAHSLGDVFDKRVSGKPSRIPTRRGSLSVLELDAAAAVATWLKPRRPALARLIERGTLLDSEDVGRLLKLPLPGLDELAAFLAMTALERAGKYDEIIVDTAPTGHTLRLLDVPRLINALAELLDAMHARHVMVARALGGAGGADALVDELRRDAADVDRRLHDRARCAISWVTLPEVVTVQETIDGIEWLRAGGFPVESVVVNRVTPSRGTGCAECRARAEHEKEALAPLAAKAQSLRLFAIDDFGAEPRGVDALRRIGAELSSVKAWAQFKPAAARRRAVRENATRRSEVPTPPPAAGRISPELRLVFFGGKGGVGKTTCAAATALAVASDAPRRQVRLISTDPAPSLGDVLGMRIGDAWQAVPGRWHLLVRELDAAAVFDEYRRRYQSAVGDFFDRLSSGSVFDATADRAVFERLFDLAPPGIDELIALLTVADVLRESSDDLLIVDTAPTGHTLRLLAMQGDVQQWIALLMQLVLKYRLAARAESLARDLVQLSRGLREFRALLTDPTRAHFVAVVRPATLPRLETGRLLEALGKMKIVAPTLIVNGETQGTCAACARRAAAEQAETMRLRELCQGARTTCDIMHAPIRIPPPRGVLELLEWRARWRLDTAVSQQS
jgi:arsenite-transporting ATPase